ncbi:hypothetical protein QBC33DRAFT_558430 [Phialemonium atrogriseum]|uniref:Uncharacterized protein n=1 Tax=Phialemonium atrogriseum TaxID=1093897 RepID=A0AAJ0FPL4_9PEZI|nr:uncharacterized protein QBC33DRAFT_558430 [Phialemonium atrogriseum]KAK1768270.1 hypothetical protein QBC33DRAFT_558430 [Phialemonium atrogriseum]
MARGLIFYTALLASCVSLAQAQECSSTGLDYTNGGSYLIDGTSDDYFVFTSAFSGCDDTDISPILIDPDGNDYSCTDIATQPDDTDQVSQCDIRFSEMTSGEWSVIIQSQDFDFAVERVFTLTVGAADVVTVTVVPTVVVGVTSTPEATTITNDIYETDIFTAEPGTVTQECEVPTQTIVQYIPGETTTVYTTIQRVETNGAVTQYYDTTLESWASCHWPETRVRPTSDRAPPPQSQSSRQCSNGDQSWFTGGDPTNGHPTYRYASHQQVIHTLHRRANLSLHGQADDAPYR